MKAMVARWIHGYALELLFILSAAATLSSLVLSNVLGYPPCDLCWYQRIFMFPLPLIYGTGLALKDKRALIYGLPLIVAGSLIALYHNLLQWGIVSDNVLECSFTAVSCADPIINWFGFMTIPLGSLGLFLVLGTITIVVRKKDDERIVADKSGANRLLWLAGGLLLATMLSVALINWLD